MCRNIRPLFNFDPPATDEEIRAAAVQFVRKITGYNTPPKDNEAAFNEAVELITDDAKHLLGSLHTHAHPKNRAVEAAKAHARSAKRFPR
ncbi:MAG TPA: DUF2277 domain-containing protein [Candidatus Saccharimonadales bacterium]|nr:DUF2277 domain-containing protein [Candidatus Saccharimonadales bacterium]